MKIRQSLIIISTILCSINFYACQSDPVISNMEVSAVEYVTSTSFVVFGNINSGIYNSYGFILSHDELNKKTTKHTAWEAKGLPEYIGYCYDLEPATKYSITMFVAKGNDTIYSTPTEVFTKTKQVIIDSRDQKEYEYVNIGNQYWLAENMNYYTPNSIYYNNDSINNAAVGRLYTCQTAQNVCPDGWHLPTDNDWKTLEAYIGMPAGIIDDLRRPLDDYSGMPLLNLKIESYFGIESTNEFGFNSKLCGYYNGQEFDNKNSVSKYWTSDSIFVNDKYYMLSRGLNKFGNLTRDELDLSNNQCQLSVRCIKD